MNLNPMENNNLIILIVIAALVTIAGMRLAG